jgi:hypothetical protein
MSKVPEVAEGEEPRPTQLESMQANIEAQIALLIAPTTITGPLYSEPVIIEEEIIEQEQTVLDTEE